MDSVTDTSTGDITDEARTVTAVSARSRADPSRIEMDGTPRRNTSASAITDSIQTQDQGIDPDTIPDPTPSQSGTTPIPATLAQGLPEHHPDDIRRAARLDSVVKLYWNTFVSFCAIWLPLL